MVVHRREIGAGQGIRGRLPSPDGATTPPALSSAGGRCMNAITAVEDEVRELVRRRGLDPMADPGSVRRLVDEVISDYDERSVGGTLPQLVDARQAARAVFDAVAGFGP